MKTKTFISTLVLVACLLCSLGAKAAEAYACYTSSNTTLTFYYDGQRSMRPGTIYDLNSGSNSPDWYTDGTRYSVTAVVFDPSFADARPTSTSYWFCVMINLRSVTGMEYLNTSEVTDMSHMFQSCLNLTTVDVSHFNTAKVTDMGYMFNGSLALRYVDVSGFNTSQVTEMTHMFDGCSVLESLDLSNFNTSRVTRMNRMFGYCSNLTTLDLHSFNTAAVREFFGMFLGCSNLTTIYTGRGWTTASAVSYDDMFLNCTSLVGGMGTTWDENHTDAE